jgi:hypothetical protein
MQVPQMSNHNDITGDKLITKSKSKAFDDNFDKIDWDEKRMDVIGSNGNDGTHYGWHKHDGSIECPVDKDATVEVETWTPHKVKTKAYMILWKNVKFYRVIQND